MSTAPCLVNLRGDREMKGGEGYQAQRVGHGRSAFGALEYSKRRQISRIPVRCYDTGISSVHFVLAKARVILDAEGQHSRCGEMLKINVSNRSDNGVFWCDL
jgi:hypothetical protein